MFIELFVFFIHQYTLQLSSKAALQFHANVEERATFVRTLPFRSFKRKRSADHQQGVLRHNQKQDLAQA